jgi:hypothetical protein
MNKNTNIVKDQLESVTFFNHAFATLQQSNLGSTGSDPLNDNLAKNR